MAGFNPIANINPVIVSIVTQPLQAVAFRPGEVLHGIIQSVEPQTIIRFGGIVVPVDPIVGVQAGQAVTAEVVRTADGTRLRLFPIPPGTTAPLPAADTVPPAARALSEAVVEVLRALGRLDAAEHAPHLLPEATRQSPPAMRLVLTLLLDRDSGGADLARVAQLVRDATAAGAIPSDRAHALAGALRALTIEDDLPAASRRAATAAQRPLAARLAEAIANGAVQPMLDSLHEDATVLLRRLKDDAAFMDFLRATGQTGEFARASDRIIERLTAAQLANARGLDAPYLFFELPFTPGAPIEHAQIHVMGDGGGRGRRFDRQNASLVLDLRTTALGDLWITLTVSSGDCTCWLRAQSLAAAEALQANAPELTARLADAGYPRSIVLTALWDGDRVRELAAILRPFRGLNIEA